MLVPVLLFLLGFVLLIKGGDWFVDGSVGIAHRLHLPEMLIGATIVSIGTTLPEVMVSSQAAMQGNAGISYGNAIGSIICNTSLIAAITLTFRPGKVNRKSLLLPAAFFFGAAAVYAIIAYTSGRVERWQGALFLLTFVIYLTVSAIHMKKHPEEAGADRLRGEPAGGKRHKDRGGAWRAGQRDRPDHGGARHFASRTDHGDHLPDQGTQQPFRGQCHRRQPVQYRPGQRRGDHHLTVFDPRRKNAAWAQCLSAGGYPCHVCGHADPLPARHFKGKTEALAGDPSALHLCWFYPVPVLVITWFYCGFAASTLPPDCAITLRL